VQDGGRFTVELRGETAPYLKVTPSMDRLSDNS
jgi:hypothetical protein